MNSFYKHVRKLLAVMKLTVSSIVGKKKENKIERKKRNEK